MYEEIPILEAAARCGIGVDYVDRKTEVKVKCCFCDDHREHLFLNTDKNMFLCHRCGERGNSVSLYAKLKNVDNRTAYMELKDDTAIHIPTHRSITIMRQPKHETKIKPLESRHDVYYDLLQMLELSKKHKNDLLSRGLDSTVIEANMYRTVPFKHSKKYGYLMHVLSESHDLSGIPGFYPQGANWHMYVNKGMFIPVCNQHGCIQGLQIRRDDVSEDKYRWFSSNYFDGGTKCPSYIHIANWHGSKTAYIAEGPLKAEVSSFLMGGKCVIGPPGVNKIDGLDKLLLNLGIEEVIEAYDMDKFTNPRVAKAFARLNEMMANKGIKYRHATWNPTYNGLDDIQLHLSRSQKIAS